MVRQEEEARIAEEEAAAKAETQAEERREARAAARALAKKEGRLLTGKAKKEADRLAAMRTQLLARSDTDFLPGTHLRITFAFHISASPFSTAQSQRCT